jgi:hypothetical protein
MFREKVQNGGDIADGTGVDFSGFSTINPVSSNPARF